MSRRVFSLMALALERCATILPESGPSHGTAVNGASIRIGNVGEQAKLFYALVRVSSNVRLNLARVEKTDTFSPQIVTGGPAGGGISVSDSLAITIFEAAAGGLFIPAEPGMRSGNYVTPPPQQVDQAGNILIPFAGTVHVAGMSTRAVSGLVRKRLSDRAIDPQVVVTVTGRRSNAVVVTGDVTTSARFVLAPSGERLLGAIARAGVPKYPSRESVVTLQRGGRTERAVISRPVFLTLLLATPLIFLPRRGTVPPKRGRSAGTAGRHRCDAFSGQPCSRAWR